MIGDRVAYQSEIAEIFDKAVSDLDSKDMEIFIRRVQEMLDDIKE